MSMKSIRRTFSAMMDRQTGVGRNHLCRILVLIKFKRRLDKIKVITSF